LSKQTVVGIGEPERECFFAAIGGKIVHRAQCIGQFLTIPDLDFNALDMESGTARG
jgi:hypothetical protein